MERGGVVVEVWSDAVVVVVVVVLFPFSVSVVGEQFVIHSLFYFSHLHQTLLPMMMVILSFPLYVQ